MTDYLLLYSGGSMPETEEEQKTVMDAWNTWMGQLGSSLKDGGNPFAPASKTISNDGSVSDGGGSASGYSIISADLDGRGGRHDEGLSGAAGRPHGHRVGDPRADVRASH